MKEGSVRGIGASLGEVEAVEIQTRQLYSCDSIRVRVRLPIEEPIILKKAVSFRGEEFSTVDLEYEKLSKVCFKCNRLTHDQYHCRYSKRGPSGFPPESSSRGASEHGSREASKESSKDASKGASTTSRGESSTGVRGKGKGRGRGRGRRGGRGEGSLPTPGVKILEPEQAENQHSPPSARVISRLGNDKALEKQKVPETEWEANEYSRAPPNYNKSDDKVGKKISGIYWSLIRTLPLGRQVVSNDYSPGSSSSKKKKKSSAERRRAKKRARTMLLET